MARTTEALVKAVLGDNYGTQRAGTLPSVQQFIDAATLTVTRVATCATAKGLTLTSDELEMIERWLAAHLYCQMDMLYQSKGTKGASASFQGTTGMALDSTRYGQTAKNLDYSGCLTAIDKRAFARIGWLGKQPAEQTEYEPGIGR